MVNIDKIKSRIVKQFALLDPEQVILFGSYANGIPNENSDLDIYVVTKDNFIPMTWKEKNQIYLKYSNAIRSLQHELPIDLIVHTKAMHSKFVETNSSFYQTSILNGMRLC